MRVSTCYRYSEDFYVNFEFVYEELGHRWKIEK